MFSILSSKPHCVDIPTDSTSKINWVARLEVAESEYGPGLSDSRTCAPRFYHLNYG